MIFVKLKSTVDINQYNTREVVQSYGKIVDGIWQGIKYYNVESSQTAKIWSLIPTEYHPNFFINIMSINCNIPPHTDSGILSTINVYIQPDNCVTSFYKVTGKVVTNQVENQTNGAIFDKSCLTKIDEFSAYANEVYLLDVTVPHAVTSKEHTPIERIAVCMQSKTKTFEEVYSMLKSTNKI